MEISDWFVSNWGRIFSISPLWILAETSAGQLGNVIWICRKIQDEIHPGKIFIRKQWQFLLNSKTLVAPEAGSYKAIKCGTGHFIREGGFCRHVGKISLSMAPSPFITVRLSDYNVIPSPPMLLRLSDIVICHISLPASLSTDDQVMIVLANSMFSDLCQNSLRLE